MDKDNGGNNERQLFHGTDAKNISAINTQGFNRSFCGVNGKSSYIAAVRRERKGDVWARIKHEGRSVHKHSPHLEYV